MSLELIQKKMFLRTQVRSMYDLQKLRIQMGNRIVGNFKAKLGQLPSKKEETLSAADKKLLDRIRADYKKLTDGVVNITTLKKNFKGEGIINDFAELRLIDSYVQLERHERNGFATLEETLESFPIWSQYLSGIDGIGPQMAGVVIGEINIHDYWKNPASGERCLKDTPGAEKKVCKVSTLWKYAGLAVEPDGLGQSRREEHLIDRVYKAKDGKMKTKKSITFNPFLKTKLLGVLATSFMRIGIKWVPCSKSQFEAAPEYKRAMKEKLIDGKKKEVPCILQITHPLVKTYFDYRWRLENHPKYKDEAGATIPEAEPLDEIEETPENEEAPKPKAKSKKGHRHRMALRYMIKIFLLQLHAKWRELEGYDPTPPYHEAKLGIKH